MDKSSYSDGEEVVPDLNFPSLREDILRDADRSQSKWMHIPEEDAIQKYRDTSVNFKTKQNYGSMGIRKQPLILTSTLQSSNLMNVMSPKQRFIENGLSSVRKPIQKGSYENAKNTLESAVPNFFKKHIASVNYAHVQFPTRAPKRISPMSRHTPDKNQHHTPPKGIMKQQLRDVEHKVSIKMLRKDELPAIENKRLDDAINSMLPQIKASKGYKVVKPNNIIFSKQQVQNIEYQGESFYTPRSKRSPNTELKKYAVVSTHRQKHVPETEMDFLQKSDQVDRNTFLQEIRMKKEIAFAGQPAKLSLTHNEVQDAYARVKPKIRRQQVDWGIGQRVKPEEKGSLSQTYRFTMHSSASMAPRLSSNRESYINVATSL